MSVRLSTSAVEQMMAAPAARLELPTMRRPALRPKRLTSASPSAPPARFASTPAVKGSAEMMAISDSLKPRPLPRKVGLQETDNHDAQA